jgi:hypothetical protein
MINTRFVIFTQVAAQASTGVAWMLENANPIGRFAPTGATLLVSTTSLDEDDELIHFVPPAATKH